MAENELKDDGVRLQNRWKTGHWDMKELDASMNMLQRVGARCFTHAITNKPGGITSIQNLVDVMDSVACRA
jgi:Ran GTPase-activating protein 1